MRVNLVVVVDPGRQLTHDGLGIRSGTDADIVAFDCADEGFSHSIALRTFDGRRSRFKPDIASEAAGIACNVAAAIVGQPFDGERQAVDPAEPMLDGGHHQVPHIVAGDAARGGEEAHGFPVTAIEREGNPHPLAIVAADLEAIGAPASIALIDRDAAVMPPLDTASMAIEQQAMGLHHPVNPLVIGRRPELARISKWYTTSGTFPRTPVRGHGRMRSARDNRRSR